MSEVARLFKARYSYDYLQIEPLVLTYLAEHNYPSLAVSSVIEDYVREQGPSHCIDNNRLKHCISRVLGRFGYEKRSKRGKAWEAIKGWCIRQADVRKKSPVHAWKKDLPDIEADFKLVDTHPVKIRNRKHPVHNTSPVMISLSVFFPVY